MGLCRARGRLGFVRHRGSIQYRRTFPAHGARHACLLSMATPPRHPVASTGRRLGSESRVHARGATELHIHHHRDPHSYRQRVAHDDNTNLQRAPVRLLGRPVVQRSVPTRPPVWACDGGRVPSPCEDGLHASTHNSGEFLEAFTEEQRARSCRRHTPLPRVPL
jgi:hypothetical protein